MRRPLEIAAAAEFASLLILLLNLFTVHLGAITSLGGPVHGCAYLFVVILTLRHPAAGLRVKLLALIPGVGGLLILRRLPTSR